MSEETCNKTVLVTGFGPFGHHTVNASWVAVKELDRLWGERGTSNSPSQWTLKTREVPVEYSFVSGSLHQIYADTAPGLCVHVGVSPYDKVTLERRGQNNGYQHVDITGKHPSSECCVENGPDEIVTRFDLEHVCKSISPPEGVEFAISEDAGRYLCDFIYYKSLHISRCPVLFIHVPPLDTPYSASQLGQALFEVLTILLAEMDSSSSACS